MPYSLTTALGPQAIPKAMRPCSRKHVARRSRMQQRGYRYYNPGLGRWTSRDPIGELRLTVSTSLQRKKLKYLLDRRSLVVRVIGEMRRPGGRTSNDSGCLLGKTLELVAIDADISAEVRRLGMEIPSVLMLELDKSRSPADRVDPNNYAYVQNNTANMSDPLGLETIIFPIVDDPDCRRNSGPGPWLNFGCQDGYGCRNRAVPSTCRKVTTYMPCGSYAVCRCLTWEQINAGGQTIRLP
jgi:hypothetical protein